jgi:hypothetical protein
MIDTQHTVSHLTRRSESDGKGRKEDASIGMEE